MTSPLGSAGSAATSGSPEGAELVAPGLWFLRGRPRHAVNVYVMGDVLVDSGTRHAASRIRRQVRGVKLKAHVLTHAHIDHMGSTHELCETLKLPLLCSAAERSAAETGGLDSLASKPTIVRVEHRLLAGEGHPVDETLREGDEVAGFEVLETPGHTAGHISFWRESDRVLVVGDVLFNLSLKTLRPGLQLPPDFLTADPGTNLRSARRLAELEPKVVCFGHGPPLNDPGVVERFFDSIDGRGGI